MSWTNEDGLTVLFDLERGPTVRPDGVTRTDTRTLRYTIVGTDLADTDTAAAHPYAAVIPAGAVIKSAMVSVSEAFAGGALDLGFKQADGTNIDDDGIDSAVAAATLAANAVVEADGALVPSRAAQDMYVMATWDTSAFTAGVAELVIEYTVH